MTHRIAAPLPWLAGLLAIYLIAPLVAVAQQAGAADWSSVDIPALLRASAVSIGSATTATIIIAIGGIPLGYLLARLQGRAIATLGFLVQLPLALPPLASGILLLFLVGYSAPLGRITNGALTDSFAGIVLAEVFVAAPFLIIAARSVFGAMDRSLEDVAATSGRSPLYVFFRVSMPIARPAILSGLLLAWLRAFGEFGATVMVAYHPYSLPVYTYVAFGAQGLPAMLPVLLPTLVLAFAIIILSNVAGSDNSHRASFSPPPGVFPDVAPAIPTRMQTQTGSIDLAFRIEKHVGSFRLDIQWSPRAQRLAILGPSGSGKSLSLKIIAGIESSDRAAITINGRDISTLNPAARGIAYVPQNYGLFPHLTVMEHLSFPVGSNPSAAKHWIDRLGLRGLEQRRPNELSLGQQQRVALGRALVRPACLLLLDEPFSALDAPLRLKLREEMLALQRELAIATTLVTHDPAEAALLADEIMVLESGRILQSASTESLFQRPANEAVARLLGAETVANGIATASDSIAIGADVILKVAGPALSPGARVGWAVSSTRVRISRAGYYHGLIESVACVGLGRRVVIRLGEARIYALAGYGDYVTAEPCRLDIEPDAVCVWPAG